MKTRIIFTCILIMIFVCSCMTRNVTHDALETIGQELFSKFRYHISKDITLREIVMLGEHMEQTGPGKLTVTNAEIHIGCFKTGRFLKEIPPDRIEIYFEELPNGNRPTLTFLLNVTGNNQRYYIETTSGEGYVVDSAGPYGYIKMKGEIVSYNGLNYFINYYGDEKPYLLQELDVNVNQEKQEMQGF